MSSNLYNRKPAVNEKGTLNFEVPERHILMGYILVPEDELSSAKDSGAVVVNVKCGKANYRATVEKVCRDGNYVGGYWVLPVSRWSKTSTGRGKK